MDSHKRQFITLAGATGLASWHTPIINTLVLPAHAQTSACPNIVIADVSFEPLSFAALPASCQAVFSIHSSSTVELQIENVTTDALPDNVTIEVQNLGPATSSSGPTVIWRGPASDAPVCTDRAPDQDIQFTITASCEGNDSFTQTFGLLSLLGN